MKQYFFLSFCLCVLFTACESTQPTKKLPAEVINSIQACSKIYTSEFQVNKIIIYRDSKHFKSKVVNWEMDITLPGGERMIAIPTKATLKSYVDLAMLNPQHISFHKDSLYVQLPSPKIEITSTQIQHDEIRSEVGAFRSEHNDEELTAIQKELREAIIQDIPKLGIIEEAQKSATRTLSSLLGNFGFDTAKINITFADEVAEQIEQNNLSSIIEE